MLQIGKRRGVTRVPVILVNSFTTTGQSRVPGLIVTYLCLLICMPEDTASHSVVMLPVLLTIIVCLKTILFYCHLQGNSVYLYIQ